MTPKPDIPGWPPERVQAPRVASMLGLSLRQVQDMAARGEIPTAARFGSRWTFDETAVRKWIRAREREEDQCRQRAGSIGAGKHGGVASVSPAASTREAYERAIGLKRGAGSKAGMTNSRESMSRASRGSRGKTPSSATRTAS